MTATMRSEARTCTDYPHSDTLVSAKYREGAKSRSGVRGRLESARTLADWQVADMAVRGFRQPGPAVHGMLLPMAHARSGRRCER